MPEKPAIDVGGHYGRVMAKLDPKQHAAALGIYVLMIAASWGNWRGIGWTIATMVAIVPLNIWINGRLIPRRGPLVGELLRTTSNGLAAALTGHATHWVLPAWLWLPFVALAFDGSLRMLKIGTLVAMWALLTTVARLDGVPWVQPATVGLLVYLCLVFTDGRVKIIHEMFEQSEKHRDALDDAHVRLKSEVEARERAEIELRQGQKLEAIGRLASGVAHEINNPLQYASSSVAFLAEAFGALTGLLDTWRERLRAAGAAVSPDVIEGIDGDARAVGIDALRADLADSLSMANDGLQRMAAIVSSMKELAHPEQDGMAPADLNAAIRATLVVARYEYKFVADVETDLVDLPLVECHGGAIGQVLLNLVVNAAHAIADLSPGERGRITVRSRLDGDHVIVSVDDTGCGVPEKIRDKIFEPFFTTKIVGRGTGQGLAIARSIVVDKHGGTLSFVSEAGKGTSFIMRLPIRAAQTLAAAA